MSSNTNLNLLKMDERPEEEHSEADSNGSERPEESLNQSMSVLNCSINMDSAYLSNNVYSEHKSLILK